MNDSSVPPSPTATGADAAPTWHRLVVVVLSLAFFLTPYLVGSGRSAGAGGEAPVGAPLVGDGLSLVTRQDTLLKIQHGRTGLGDTLTSSWWGSYGEGQALYRPVPLFLLGVAGGLAGPYDPESPGDAPLPYHLIVLALHLIAAMLVYDLALDLVRNPRVALLAAALFATLPVHGEVIFDVSGVAELCAAVFGLAAWRAWLQLGDAPLAKPAALAGMLALLALACLSKESAFALPLVFVLVDMGRGARFDRGALQRRLPLLVASGLVLVALLGLRYAVLGTLTPDYMPINELDNPLLAVDPFTRAMNGLRILACAVPILFGINPLRGDGSLGQSFGFSTDYSADQVTALGAFSPWNLLGALLVVASLVLAARVVSRRCALRAALWFGLLASMLVTSNILFPIGTVFGERLLYFPSVLLVLLVAITLGRLGKAGLVAGLVLALGGGAWTQSRADGFTDPWEVWRESLRRGAPYSAKGHFSVGRDLMRSGIVKIAQEHYEQAIEIFPGYINAHGELGLALEQQGEKARALESYVRSIELYLENVDYRYRPDSGLEPTSPGNLLYRTTLLRVFDPEFADRREEHLAWLEGLIAAGYESPHAYVRVAETLRQLRRPEEAERAFQESLAIEPVAAAVLSYSEFLSSAGRTGDAEALLAEYTEPARFALADHLTLLLERAAAELQRDPAVALATAEQALPIARALASQLELRTNLFRAHWIWAQARLEQIPAGAGAEDPGWLEVERHLLEAFAAYSPVDGETLPAHYVLAETFDVLRRSAEQITYLEGLLANHDAPTLRTRLARAYERTDEPVKALDNWRAAVDDLAAAVAEAEQPDEELLRQLLLARVGALRLASVLDGADAGEALLLSWSAAEDPATAAMVAEWRAAWGDLGQAAEEAAGLADAAPDLPGVADLSRRLADLAAGAAEHAATLALGWHRLQWENYAGALEAAELALPLAADDLERASALQLASAAMAEAGDLTGALERVEAALALDLPDAQREQLEDQRAQLAAALGG